MGRQPEVIVYERTREVFLYMNNVSKHNKEILRYFADKWTQDGYFRKDQKETSKYRTIQNYIQKCKKTYYNYEQEIESEKGRTLARLDELYSKLVKVQDYKGALTVLKELGDIVGYKAASKTDITTQGEKIQITFESGSKD